MARAGLPEALCCCCDGGIGDERALLLCDGVAEDGRPEKVDGELERRTGGGEKSPVSTPPRNACGCCAPEGRRPKLSFASIDEIGDVTATAPGGGGGGGGGASWCCEDGADCQ